MILKYGTLFFKIHIDMEQNMIVLDVAPQTIQVIEQVAQKNGQSVQDFILMSAYEKALQSFHSSLNQSDTLVLDFIKGKTLQSFQGDPVAIQRAMRDEWE